MKIKEVITESSLSRVWKLFNDPQMSCAVFTAFRGRDAGDPEMTDAQLYQRNVKRNEQLAADLRSLGYGYFYADGHWIENQGTPQERPVKEDVVFVAVKNAGPDFADNIHRLGNKFDQEAVLVKDAGGTRLIFKDGSEDSLGKIQPGGMGDIYTQLRGNKKANTFVFEGERNELGFVARIGGVERLRARGVRGV